MKELQKQIEKKVEELNKQQNKIETFMKNAPKGSLIVRMKKGRPAYYCQLKNKKNEVVQKYIPKGNLKFAQELAQKGYYKKLWKHVSENQKALHTFMTQFHFEDVEEIYDCLSPERKLLVQPIDAEKRELIKQWKEVEKKNCENYPENQTGKNYPENLIYETERGEFVRSKSEVIIANLLYKHQDKLLYKYECSLELKRNGKVYIVHPDFAILNIKTGKITYWEHWGMMDNEDYVNDFMWKHNLYVENNILCGKQILYTYETREWPLEIRGVKKMISNLLEE